jgi:hypothetical protein
MAEAGGRQGADTNEGEERRREVGNIQRKQL